MGQAQAAPGHRQQTMAAIHFGELSAWAREKCRCLAKKWLTGWASDFGKCAMIAASAQCGDRPGLRSGADCHIALRLVIRPE
jgi:hypothetical protein